MCTFMKLNCQHSTELISQSQDRPLKWKEKFALRVHLFFCKYCRRFSNQMTVLSQLMSQYKKDSTSHFSDSHGDKENNRTQSEQDQTNCCDGKQGCDHDAEKSEKKTQNEAISAIDEENKPKLVTELSPSKSI